MLIRIPTPLIGKVKYIYKDVAIVDGVTLTEEEEKIFSEFQSLFRKRNEERFEYDET